MSNRRKIASSNDPLSRMIAQLDHEQNTRAAVMAQVTAASHGGAEAVRALMPRGDDPESLGNALITSVGIAAELLHRLSGGVAEREAEILAELWDRVPFGLS